MGTPLNGTRAPHKCVVGIQWGDEGKGKIVDVLTAEADVVVRYQGGANAGHTVKVGENEYVLHLIPSGVLQEGKQCVIGNGVVVDPKALIEEFGQLADAGLGERESSIWVSDRAHVVLPYHKELDAAKESGASQKLGTTLRGIGPCYADKASRTGIRMSDFVDLARFKSLLERNVAAKNLEITKLYGREPLDAAAIFEEYRVYAERLAPRVRDISGLLWEEHRKGSRILFEGAQGVLLDVDLGTYPYVTSSSTSFLGLGPGTGFSPRQVGTVLGILKAYTTRVGEGPFPTELNDEVGQKLRDEGQEYGATTGRPRRCGWIDFVAVRRTVEVGDVDALVITKLDVLDCLDEIQVVKTYRVDGVEGPDFPASLDAEIEPVLTSVPGWKSDISACRKIEDLPQAARDYLQLVADETNCPIAIVSVGKDRAETIHLDPWIEPKS